MQIQCVALLLLCFPAVLDARRVDTRKRAREAVEGGHACHVTENEYSLKYGIKGSYYVKSCMTCQFHNFLTEVMSQKVIADAEENEESGHCNCYTSPRFWESKGLDKKLWFEFNMRRRGCSKADCKDVFLTWANMFNKKKTYPADNERMPVNEYIESQEGYTFHCDDSTPEGLHLPSPKEKILELRLLIEKCTDPEEKLRLEQMLAKLLEDKEMEIFSYDLEADWGPEREVDETSGDEHDQHHTFFLKPCVSQSGREVTELKEIYENCNTPELGVSMKSGQLKVHYEVDEPWGPERECKPSEEECQKIMSIAHEEGIEGEILTFRLRPCTSSHTGDEITELSEILAEKACGDPSTHQDSDGFATLLPVKMDVALKYDEAAPDADLTYPCTDQ